MSDTIDITDLVEKTRSTFVDWAVLYVYGLEIAIPGMEWVAVPVIKDIDQEIIRLVLNGLSNSAVMQSFFLATVVRKATQADDFVAAVVFKQNLPDNVTDEEYDLAERKQMDAFRDFVAVTA